MSRSIPWTLELYTVLNDDVEFVEKVREGQCRRDLTAHGNDETTIEADPRHVKILLNELNLVGAKTVTSPGVISKDEDETPLSAEDSSRFRSLVMRCNYLALDRPDICFAAKELARRMQSPTRSSWNGLKRMARFLAGHPRLIWR